MAFVFVSDSARRAVLADFYAFCRIVDDIVDTEGPSLEARQVSLDAVSQWLKNNREVSHPYWDRLRKSIQDFELPRKCFQGIINGVSMDLDPHRKYKTWDELNNYVQGVACDVGEVVLHILGARSPELKNYALMSGRCVQYLNILRDLEEDLSLKRSYVPEEFLHQKKIKYTSENFQIIRNEFYKRALQFRNAAPPYSKKCMPAEIMIGIYLEGAKQYWSQGINKRLSSFRKFWIALKIFIKMQSH